MHLTNLDLTPAAFSYDQYIANKVPYFEAHSNLISSMSCLLGYTVKPLDVVGPN